MWCKGQDLWTMTWHSTTRPRTGLRVRPTGVTEERDFISTSYILITLCSIWFQLMDCIQNSSRLNQLIWLVVQPWNQLDKVFCAFTNNWMVITSMCGMIRIQLKMTLALHPSLSKIIKDNSEAILAFKVTLQVVYPPSITTNKDFCHQIQCVSLH